MRGHIQEIKGEKDDEFWSMNVKRGILSLLEMNFEERRSASTKERLVELNRDRSSPVDYYRVMEVNIRKILIPTGINFYYKSSFNLNFFK